MSNMRDIAKYSGLSIATVSRYINKTAPVSSSSAEQIEAAIKALNYTVNEHAKAVFAQKTGIIGLIFPDFMNPFFAEFATVLGQKLQDAGYRTILAFTEDHADKEASILKMMKGYKIDGLVIIRPQQKEMLRACTMPVVSVETEIEGASFVTADNFRGGEIAFRHLYVDCGRQKLLHIKGPAPFQATSERSRGFLMAAQRAGLDVDVYELDCDSVDEEALHKHFGQIPFEDYDGVFAFNDNVGCQLISYLAGQGIRVPEDIAVMGFDHSRLSGLITPRLTTIRQSVRSMAQHSFELLLEGMHREDENYVGRSVIPVQLVQRESTNKL